MLKSLLSLLLSKFYSKKESELVGHQAMPNVSETSVTEIELQTGNGSYAYTAPYDGYFNVEMTAGSSINIWGACPMGASSSQTNIVKLFAPVPKGGTVYYLASGTVKFSRFIGLMGGGIKLLRTLFCKEVCYVA